MASLASSLLDMLEKDDDEASQVSALTANEIGVERKVPDGAENHRDLESSDVAPPAIGRRFRAPKSPGLGGLTKNRQKRTIQDTSAEKKKTNMEKKLVSVRNKLKSAMYGTDPLTFFKRFDADKSGTLDRQEFTKLVRTTLKIPPRSISDQDIRDIYLSLDDDQSGDLSLRELADFIGRGDALPPHALSPTARQTLSPNKRASGAADKKRMTVSPQQFAPQLMDDSEAKGRANCWFKFVDPANKKEITPPMLANAIRMNYFLRSPPGLAPLVARIVAKYTTIHRFLLAVAKANDGMDLYTRIRNEFGEFEVSKVKTFSGSTKISGIRDGGRGFGASEQNPDAPAKPISENIISTIQSKLKAAMMGTDPLIFFKRYDADHSGEIDLKEFKKIIRGPLKMSARLISDEEIRDVLVALDDDQSGEMSVKELADFVRRGVSTDPRDIRGLKRSLLLFDSYGENEIRRFVTMCEDIDEETTMPNEFSKTRLSESPKLIEFKRQVEGFFALADPSKTGGINLFMFEQTLQVVLQSRARAPDELVNKAVKDNAAICGRLVDKILTFKETHKIKSVKEVHTILDTDNTGCLSRGNLVFALVSGLNYEAMQAMRQPHPMEEPSQQFESWPTSANSDRKEGFLRSCVAELELFMANSSMSFRELWNCIDIKRTGKISRTEFARAIQYNFNLHRPTVAFETPMRRVQAPPEVTVDISQDNIDRKIRNTFRYIDKFGTQSISMAQWNECFKTLGPMRTGIQARKQGKLMVQRLQDLFEASGATYKLQEWFLGLVGKDAPGSTFHLLHVQQRTLVKAIRQMALDIHRLDLTFDDSEASALTRYIDCQAKNVISFADIMEALDSLHSNVRADRENLMTAVHDVGVNATSSVTDTDMEAEEDVISMFELMERHMKATSMRASDLFKQMDYDGEGTISFDEMELFFQTIHKKAKGSPEKTLKEEEEAEESWFEALIREFDKSNDGVVTKVEYVTMWTKIAKELDRELPLGNTGREPRELIYLLRQCIGDIKKWYATFDTSKGQDKLKSWELWTFLRQCNKTNRTEFERLDADRIIRYFNPKCDGTCSLSDIEEGFERVLNPSESVVVALANARFIRAVNAWFRDNLSSTGQVYDSWDIVNFNKCRLTTDQLRGRLKQLGLKAGVRHDDFTPWLVRGRGDDTINATLSETKSTKESGNSTVTKVTDDGVSIKDAVEDVFAIADEHSAGAFDESAFERSFRKVRQLQSASHTGKCEKYVMSRFLSLMEAARMDVDQLFFACLGSRASALNKQFERERYMSVATFTKGISRLASSLEREDLAFNDTEIDTIIRYIDYQRRGTIQMSDINDAVDRTANQEVLPEGSFMTFEWLEKLMDDRHMKVRTLFDIIDTDGTGLVTREKLAHAMVTDFCPTSNWSPDVDAKILRQFDSCVRLVEWIDVNSDGIIEKSDFPERWRSVSEIAAYELPEVRQLCHELEILIFQEGVTVTEWFRNFHSPDGLSGFQIFGWLESANPGKYQKADGDMIIKYVDRKGHICGSLNQFQAAFLRIRKKPGVVEQLAMEHTSLIAPINRVLRRRGLKPADLWNQWDPLRRGRLTVAAVCEGLTKAAQLQQRAAGSQPSAHDHVAEWRS